MVFQSTPRLLIAVTHPMTARYLMAGQLSYLNRAGFDVLLASAGGADLEVVEQREGVGTRSISMARKPRPWRDLASLVRMSRLIRQIRPLIVNASTPKAGLLGMLAARMAGVPVRIYTLRGLRLETIPPPWRSLLLRLERLAASSSTRVICVSESLRARALDLQLFAESKAEVLGGGSSNGVDTDRFQPADAQARKAARKGLGIPESASVLGFVGRQVRDKGVEDLAEIFLDSISEDYPDAHLLLIGDYEEADPVQKGTKQRLESHPRVLHMGFVEDVALYYRAMDLLVFPSYREGFPNAPLEAAASGVPVAGYSATGTVDAVVDGTTGTLVPVGSRDALLRSVCKYLDSPELASRHGIAGRERAVREYRQELVWERWSAFYRRELEQMER